MDEAANYLAINSTNNRRQCMKGKRLSFSEMTEKQIFEYHYIKGLNKWIKQSITLMEDHSMKSSQRVITHAYLDIEVEDRYSLLLRAYDLFSDDKCFLCNVGLKWGNDNIDDTSGRMYNINGHEDKVLNRDNWFSICYECLYKLNLKDNRKTIINIKYKDSLINNDNKTILNNDNNIIINRDIIMIDIDKDVDIITDY